MGNTAANLVATAALPAARAASPASPQTSTKARSSCSSGQNVHAAMQPRSEQRLPIRAPTNRTFAAVLPQIAADVTPCAFESSGEGARRRRCARRRVSEFNLNELPYSNEAVCCRGNLKVGWCRRRVRCVRPLRWVSTRI